MEAIVYNQTGKEAGKVTLPEEIFGLPKNDDLVHQVVIAMEANRRNPTAHTKDRGEVRGGGKKPWKQKGTGRARHGSRRSPIWKGGGVTFGPRNDRDYSQKINKKMKTKALYTVLSQKLNDGEIIFVDDFAFAAPKTKDAVKSIEAFGKKKEFPKLSPEFKNGALIATAGNTETTYKSFRNIPAVTVEEVRNLNPVDILNHRYLIIENPEKAIESLNAKK